MVRSIHVFPWTGSTRTGPRCCRCHRSQFIWAGATASVGSELLRSPRHQLPVLGPFRDRETVDVTADLERVKVSTDGWIVADHARDSACGAAVTDYPAHVETAARLRNPSAVAVDNDLTRDLADRDRDFGLVIDDRNN